MLMARAARRGTALVASETLLILGAVVLMWYVRLEAPRPLALAWPPILLKALLITVVCQLCLYSRDLYEGDLLADRREMIIRLLQGLAVTSVVLAVIYSLYPGLVIGPGVFGGTVVLVALVLMPWRVALAWTATRFGGYERLLVVGTNPAALALAEELGQRQHLGVEIVGFVEPETLRTPGQFSQPGIIGTIEDIPAIVRARSVNRVVVSLADARGKLPMEKLLEMKLDGVSFAHLASVYEEYTGRISVENLRPSWLIFSAGFRQTRMLTLVKRMIDVLAAAVGLFLTLPMQLVLAAAVKLTSRGPVMYSQRRVGRDGRIFVMWKFRSMRQDAESRTGAVWARKDDDRVTPIGRYLRKMRLDELPQLWNVLIGDMSLVGPRPERPEFVTNLTKSIPFYGQRHVVKPGLTGWAQVRYTYGASTEDAMRKLQYDLFYIKHMSLWLDVYIVLRTIKIVLLGRGAC
jgi:sugar transferase (PEP-CTERM system associated)